MTSIQCAGKPSYRTTPKHLTLTLTAMQWLPPLLLLPNLPLSILEDMLLLAPDPPGSPTET